MFILNCCVRDIGYQRVAKNTRNIKVKLVNQNQTDNALAKMKNDQKTNSMAMQKKTTKIEMRKLKTYAGCDFRCSGKISISCSTRGSCRVARAITFKPGDVSNSVGHIRRQRGRDYGYDKILYNHRHLFVSKISNA